MDRLFCFFARSLLQKYAAVRDRPSWLGQLAGMARAAFRSPRGGRHGGGPGGAPEPRLFLPSRWRSGGLAGRRSAAKLCAARWWTLLCNYGKRDASTYAEKFAPELSSLGRNG